MRGNLAWVKICVRREFGGSSPIFCRRNALTRTRCVAKELVCGRYVITTSLDASEVDCTQVLGSYRSLQNLERRFKVTKNFPALRRSSIGPRTP